MIKKSIKLVLVKIDNRFETSFYEKGLRFRNIIHTSSFFNAIKRAIDPAIVKLKYKLKVQNNIPLKLHLGCGERHLDGYVNIDWRKTAAVDLVCDIRKLPYYNNSVEIIETYHVIEHIPRQHLVKALKEWYRILSPRGKLIIECPDLDRAIIEYLEGNEERLYSIYGRQRFPGDNHYWGYNAKRLKENLEKIGFTEVLETDPQDYHKYNEPCLRIEATK